VRVLKGQQLLDRSAPSQEQRQLQGLVMEARKKSNEFLKRKPHTLSLALKFYDDSFDTQWSCGKLKERGGGKDG
jgi:hypothetical protein